MPYKPKRPCSYPGCAKLTNGEYCEEHKKISESNYNKYERDKRAQKFYHSEEWKNIKRRQLVIEPFCRECKKLGMITKATIVDHVTPIKQGGMPLDISNLQSLCAHCHSKKSAVEGSRWGKRER